MISSQRGTFVLFIFVQQSFRLIVNCQVTNRFNNIILSNDITVPDVISLRRRRTRLAPTKPGKPVTRIVLVVRVMFVLVIVVFPQSDTYNPQARRVAFRIRPSFYTRQGCLILCIFRLKILIFMCKVFPSFSFLLCQP